MNTIENLSKTEKQKLLQAIALISEKSFRRGVQHSTHFKITKRKAMYFRFGKSYKYEYWLPLTIKNARNRKRILKRYERIEEEHRDLLFDIGLIKSMEYKS